MDARPCLAMGGRPPLPPQGRRGHWHLQQDEDRDTHRLTQDWVLGAVDAAGKCGEGQGRVEAEVEEGVPAFPADPDGSAETKTSGWEPALQGEALRALFLDRPRGAGPLGGHSHAHLPQQVPCRPHLLLLA